MHHRRKPLRAELYDYRQDGGYFVTIVTHRRMHLFGTVEDGLTHLNPAGEMVERYWLELERKYRQVEIEDFVVMPNHFHGILRIHPRDAINLHDESLGDMIKWFKSLTTNAYIRSVKNDNWPRFEGKLWQQGYYDHIVRDDADLARIQEYIANNPAMWEMDPDNSESEEAW